MCLSNKSLSSWQGGLETNLYGRANVTSDVKREENEDLCSKAVKAVTVPHKGFERPVL